MIAARDLVVQARSVRIEHLPDRYGILLKRTGPELIGPCPRCGGRDRFAVSVPKQIFNCRGCGARGDVIALAQHITGCSFVEAVELLAGDRALHDPRPIVVPVTVPKVSGSCNYEQDQHRKARWLWSQRQPIEGTPAERYLREARGITCHLPPTLAYLAPTKPSHQPAMISAFAMAAEVEPGVLGAPLNVGSVHLTLLAQDGRGKADASPNKIIVGRPLGMPILLAPPNDLLGLAITEGIEDGLSVYQATGLGAMAAGAAGFMPALAGTKDATDVIPSFIECVTIYAHDDPAGRLYTTELARALDLRGIEVFIEGLAR